MSTEAADERIGIPDEFYTLADEFPTYSIQNAYVVSSDDDFKENFEKLHKNDAIVPVDMTNLIFDGKSEDLTIPNAKLDAGISVIKPVTQPLEPVLETSNNLPEPEDRNVVSTSPSALVHIYSPKKSTEELLQRTLKNIETCIELSKKQEGYHSNFYTFEENAHWKVLPKSEGDPGDNQGRSAAYSVEIGRTNSIKETTLSASPIDDMAAQIQYSNHREMAIDVPEAFVASAKRPPRYPLGKELTPEPVPVLSIAALEADKIKRYQAEIQKRNDDEYSRIKKDEIMRTSLRGSRKLQALEKSAKPPPPPGFCNAAFEEEMNAYEQSALVSTNGYADNEAPDAQSMKRTLEQISAALKRENGEFSEELSFIEALFDSAEFQNAADLHSLIESRQFDLTEPVSVQAESLAGTVKTLLPTCSSPDAQELQALLSTPQFENLLLTHDALATRREELAQLQCATSFDEVVVGHDGNVDGNSSFNSDAPTMPVDENGHVVPLPTSASPVQSNYVGVDMRVVRIEKSGGDPLGATIKIDPQTGGVMVARIVHGGAAQKSGLLHENDELLDVNGFDLRGRSLDEVCHTLPKRDYTMHVKAHFDFNPEDDTYPEEVRCPCTDLGLTFRKGDILHVRNQEDNWWQAYREGEEVGSTLAGLIPSKTFQQAREDHRLRKIGDGTLINGRASHTKKNVSGKGFASKKQKSKKRKKVVAGSPLDMDVGEVPWYEEVGVYYPKPSQKRPVILIGPHLVGRQELRERLMATEVDRFAAVTPHTTRSPRAGEINGHTFFFVSRHQFEEDIARGRFVEHGEFEKHLYGTSFDAIRDVATKGKICILNLQPQSLRLLRASDLKPYVVFIAPPSLDKLRQNRLKVGAAPRDDELKSIIEDAREMEDTYGHFFDLVIVNTDFDKAFAELFDEINRLEREPQWVPIEWLR